MLGATLGSTAPAGPGTVILLGLGIVFFGLICIILLISLMSWLIRLFTGEKKSKAKEKKTADAPVEIPNRAEFVAAVSAAIAEDLGQDISKIRIVSIKRL